MAITATFFAFSKRKNSTKRPSGGTSYNITIKEPFSILNPRIVLDRGNPAIYNYCYIPTYDRYYFITDWISDHNFWIAECAVDPLASWRDSIRASSQYVLRSASSYDTYLADGLYAGTGKMTYNQHTFAAAEKCFKTSTYIIGVINGTNTAPRLGGVTYYALSAAQLQSLMQNLLGDASYLGSNPLFGITIEIMQALVNPSQYIVESYLLPYEIPSNLLNPNSKLTVGWWQLPGFSANVDALQITNMVYRNVFYTQDYNYANHPQFERGAYMDGAPFHHMRISAGPFGDIDIDTNQLIYNTTAINFEVAGDYRGDVELIITGKPNGQILARRRANVAVPFVISQMFTDRLGMVSAASANVTSGVGTAIGALTGNIQGTINGAMSYGASCIDLLAQMPKMAVQGTNGSLYDINRSWVLQQEFIHVMDDDQAQRGKPLCKIRTLSTLSGYCIVADPDIEFRCYDSEYDQIASFMSTGFFLE